jgi:hypothetical protein
MRTNDISNRDNVIDGRDVIARIDELESKRTDLADAVEEAKTALADAVEEAKTSADDLTAALTEWDEENGDELKALKALVEGYVDDWTHGAKLIRRTYFVEYCEEFCKDIGDLPKDIPSYLEIDWDATAANLEADFTSVDFDGVEYLVH